MDLTEDATIDRVLAKLRVDERYSDRLDMKAVIHALASIQRTLISSDSRVDRFRRGTRDALDAAEQRGAALFDSHVSGAACHHCHDGLTFGRNVRHRNAPVGEVAYVNLGLYNLAPNGAYPAGNEGLFETFGRDADSLRRVGLSATPKSLKESRKQGSTG